MLLEDSSSPNQEGSSSVWCSHIVATCWAKLLHFQGALKIQVLVLCVYMSHSSSKFNIYNYPESYDESCATKVNEYTLLTGTSKKFAASPSQGISWSYNKLRIPMHLPPSAATEGCNYFSISYYVKVSMESSGTAKNATVTFDITIGNAYLCALQPERAQPTLNEEFGWTPERGKSAADIHSNFSLSSGATGVNSLPAADLPHHTFEPTAPQLL